jgi:glycine/D-amino acid oxidase-like deaminating enzyme
MRITVLGAGIVGVHVALELARFRPGRFRSVLT